MAQKPNKLLLTLTALGIAAGVNATEAQAQTASYGSFGEFFSYTQASFSRDLVAKVEFVRAYPQSPAAQRLSRSIARELAAMPAAERRATMDAIASIGGLPASVTSQTGLSGLATASVTGTVGTTQSFASNSIY